MRTALLLQWLRAAKGDPGRRETAHRYAAGISLAMLGWAALLVIPVPLRQPGFVLMILVELAIPTWEERVAIQSVVDSDVGLAGSRGC